MVNLTINKMSQFSITSSSKPVTATDIMSIPINTTVAPSAGDTLIYNNISKAFVYGQAPPPPVSSGVTTSDVNNTSAGKLSFGANTTGNNNTSFGYGTLSSNVSGSSNVAVGSNALF